MRRIKSYMQPGYLVTAISMWKCFSYPTAICFASPTTQTRLESFRPCWQQNYRLEIMRSFLAGIHEKFLYCCQITSIITARKKFPSTQKWPGQESRKRWEIKYLKNEIIYIYNFIYTHSYIHTYMSSSTMSKTKME